MFNRIGRLLPLLLLFHSGAALAQQPAPQPLLGLGNAVVTGFSGTVVAKSPLRGTATRSATDITFIDPDGPSVRVIDVSRPGYLWDGRLFPAAKIFSVAAKDVGQVFGIALDDAPAPNIYVAATSVFGLNIVSRGRDGAAERRKKGGPGAGWMRGQFGLELQGGPGAIYKIDGRTGAVSLFANVTLEGVPNPGAALGNLAYDSAHKQLFVSDLYTGMIHRFDLDGRDLGHYDHGVTGLAAAKLPLVAFDPKARPNIASDRFDSEKPDTWGLAPLPRRVWGLAVQDGRLYYSVVSGPQIWSVGIARDGGFAADPRWELDVPAQAGPLPVSDIAFSQKGAMILAQRALVAGAYDYSAFTRPGEPQVFRIWLKGPNDPPSPGRWKLVPEEYAVGFAGNYRNTNGGVALGYGYGAEGALSATACEFSLWTTGQNLRNNPALKSQLDPGGPLVVHGIAGVPASPVRSFNEPPWTSYFVDYDDKFDDPQASGHLGSVRIFVKPCASPAAYSGPGYPASPPYIVTTTIVRPPPDCPPNCPPPPENPFDLGIAKIGEVNLANPNGPYNFTIGVRNLGAVISNPTTLTFTDVVPAGMTYTNITSSNWSCIPLPGPPIPAGGTVTCTYTGTFPIAVNQAMGWVTIVATGGNGPYTNCAKLGQPDGDPSNDQACVTVEKGKGNLIVSKEIINHTNPQISTSGLVFPVTVTCGSSVTTLNLVDGLPQTVSNIPYGTTCTAQEGTPPIPAGLCANGQPPTWTGPVYVPSNSAQVVSGTTASINVQNTLECGPAGGGGNGYILVKKVVIAHVIGTVFPPQTYPVNVTCGGVTTTLNLSSNGTAQSVGNLAIGTPCTVNEPTPPIPPNMCPTNTTPTWTTVYLPSPNANANAPGPTVTVQNTFDCVPTGPLGELMLEKVVATPGIPSQVYPVTVTCGGTTTTLNLLDGVTQTVSNLPLGTICTIVEPPPPTPANFCPPGSNPVWSTTYIPPGSPPGSVTITSSTVTVMVRNTLACSPVGSGNAGVQITKTIVNTTSANLTGVTFPATATCGGSNSSLTLSASAAQTVSNLAAGTVCSVNEPLPAAPTTGCTVGVPLWDPPVYNPASVTAAAGTPPTLNVTNTLRCERGGYIGVRKTVINNTQADISGLSYPVTLTCTNSFGSSNQLTFNLTPSGAQLMHNLALGYVCTAVETLPAAPTTGCPAGTTPTWGPIVYAPPSVNSVTGAGPIITVQNTLNCAPVPHAIKPTLQCKSPLVANAAATECVCRSGLVLRGGKCVTPVVCREPARLNKAGTGCFCPDGMALKGNSCVEKRKEPRVTPGDVIRGLPGILPGGGGRGTKGGGAAPDSKR